MTHTFLPTDAVELAVVERSGFIESRHIGSAVALDPDGKVLKALGDVTSPMFTRSSLKPLQALGSLRAGAPLEGAQVSLATASHSGQQQHVDTVVGMLSAAGLSEDDLRCPIDLPGNQEFRAEVLRSGGSANRLYFNCSGKHAGFLSACVANGWETETYLDPQHPLQQLIAEIVREYTEEEPAAMGVDGCGAPVFAMSVTALARGVGKVAAAPKTGSDEHAAKITTMVKEYPWGIAGDGKPNTVVIEELGLLAKSGAEGVMVMANSDGVSVALKVLDGSHRGTTIAALTLLAEVGGVDKSEAERVLALLDEPVLGGGKPVGTVRVGSAFTA